MRQLDEQVLTAGTVKKNHGYIEMAFAIFSIFSVFILSAYLLGVQVGEDNVKNDLSALCVNVK